MRIYIFAVPFLVFIMGQAAAKQVQPAFTTNLKGFAVYGHVEKVALMPGDIEIKARLDTGASRSSLNARNIVLVEEAGQQWVRFIFDDHEGNLREMMQPLVEMITIKQANGRQHRYVVEMGLCVGERYEKNLFTLADRSKMTYPVLVGRNFLKNSVLVSSGHKMTAKPSCET